MKVKTGFLASIPPVLLVFRPLRALTGQQVLSKKGNKSTNSPSLDHTFGFFICTKISSFSIFTSSHKRQCDGSKFISEFDNSSPTLKLPKNRVQQAVQNTLLLSAVQSEIEISCPTTLRSSIVITFLVGVGVERLVSRDFPPLMRIFVTEFEKH